MENIGNFLIGCEKYGCVKNDLFQTVDLYEGGNIPQVSNKSRPLGVEVESLPVSNIE